MLNEVAALGFWGLSPKYAPSQAQYLKIKMAESGTVLLPETQRNGSAPSFSIDFGSERAERTWPLYSL